MFNIAPPSAETDEEAMIQALTEAGAETDPVAYIQQWKNIMKVRKGGQTRSNFATQSGRATLLRNLRNI